MHADSGIIYYNVGYRYFLLSDEAITSMSNPHYGWEDIGIKCDNTYYDNMSLYDYDFDFTEQVVTMMAYGIQLML